MSSCERPLPGWRTRWRARSAVDVGLPEGNACDGGGDGDGDGDGEDEADGQTGRRDSARAVQIIHRGTPGLGVRPSRSPGRRRFASRRRPLQRANCSRPCI